MIYSFFCMYQAKFIKPMYQNHLWKQMVWFGIGYGVCFVLQKVKLKSLFQFSFWFYLFNVLLLGLVLIFGKEVNGAKAWFHFKGLHFQPSEFAKISILFYLVEVTKEFQMQKDKKEITYLLKVTLIVLIPSVLVFLEPDTGAIVIYFLLLLGVLLFSGIRKRWFVIAFVLLSLLLGGFFFLYFFHQDLLIDLIGTSFFYRMDRLLHFQDGTGMQLNNALITIGNAGLFGHGIQKSLLYVPEFPTDFAFTLAISILGFVGACVLILCYVSLDFFLLISYLECKT